MKLSHGQKQNASQEWYLQYSFTFSHLELHGENATVTPQHYNMHLILTRRERLWLTGCFSSHFISKQLIASSES